jgi:hypothetical protein
LCVIKKLANLIAAMSDQVSLSEAFKARHSTRNFSTVAFTPEQLSVVTGIVAEANALPRICGGEVEVVQAPTGFGLLNFIVHEEGWLFAKQPITTDPDQKRKNYLETGHLLEHCIIRMAQHRIATCWIAGTFKGSKSVEFCGGNCAVPGVVAFGGDAQDRWLDRTVKWFGSFRGMNGYQDKFFDLKANAPITEESAGERLPLCSAITSIPCAMKPHAYRITFDEPNLHIYTLPGAAGFAGMELFDVGNVLAHVRLFYEDQRRTVQFVFEGARPEAPPPLGGEYVCTAVIGDA